MRRKAEPNIERRSAPRVLPVVAFLVPLVATPVFIGTLNDSTAASAQIAPDRNTESLPYEFTRGVEQAAQVYEFAAATAPCSLDWTVLGGIADVASDHGRLGGTQRLRLDGVIDPPVYGLPLDGTEGRASVPDTDQGRVDGDPLVDRAVGPFQFVPTTWDRYAVDGNGDGTADPHNLWDAAASAAALLCDQGIDTDPAAALTAYFGTDEWTAPVLDSASGLWDLEWAQHLGNGAFEAHPQDIMTAGGLLPVSAGPSDDSHIVTGSQTISGPAIVDPRADSPADLLPEEPLGPVLSGGTPIVVPSNEPQGPIVGDWNGDGLEGLAELETTSGGAAGPGPLRLVLRDHEGRPYGRSIDITRSLITVGLRPTGSSVVVGDWDGNGIDSPGVLVVQDGVATLVTYGRDGLVDELRPVGLAEPGTEFVMVDRPLETFAWGPATPSGVFWEVVTAPDGAVLTLHRVGNIVVDQSISGAVEALLAHAARDGLPLDGWGWRSNQQQIALRARHCADIWSTAASACSPPTAVPGTSRHEFGRAIDFHVDGRSIAASSAEFRWLAANAATYGLFNLPSEPWHWSTDGG